MATTKHRSAAFLDELEGYRRERERKQRAVLVALAASPVGAVRETAATGWMAMVTGEMSHPEEGSLRVTFFMPDGPRGHSTRNTIEEIAEEISSMLSGDIKPMSADQVDAYMMTSEFQIGSRIVAMIQAENTLRYLASKAKRDVRPALERARLLADAHTLEAFDAARAVLEEEIRKMPQQNAPDLIPNPPWVTKALADAYETMEERVPPKWLPKLTQTGARRGTMTAKLKEYGCGVYGCVLPTLDPGVVVKVTTDVTEAQFATELAQTLPVRVTVDYHLAMRLAAEREGRPIYALWRESAEDVGKLAHSDLISNQHEAAEAAYIEMHRTGTTTRGAIKKWRQAVIAMEADPELQFLARGMLKAYDETGVFFGDVHGGNVGKCVRDGKLEWVIIDPGHVSVVSK
jgi:hypothetical protein